MCLNSIGMGRTPQEAIVYAQALAKGLVSNSKLRGIDANVLGGSRTKDRSGYNYGWPNMNSSFVLLVALLALGVFFVWFARRPLANKVDDKPPWVT